MVDFPPELWADNGREDLRQNPDPRLLVHNVQLLETLPHGAREHMVGLQEPPPARPVLLGRGRSLAIAGEEDNLVLEALQQLIFFRQACEHVGQQRIVVGFVRVGERGGIQDKDRAAFFGGQRRAVEDRGGDFGQVVGIVGALARGRHGRQRGATQSARDMGAHAAHGCERVEGEVQLCRLSWVSIRAGIEGSRIESGDTCSRDGYTERVQLYLAARGGGSTIRA